MYERTAREREAIDSARGYAQRSGCACARLNWVGGKNLLHGWAKVCNAYRLPDNWRTCDGPGIHRLQRQREPATLSGYGPGGDGARSDWMRSPGRVAARACLARISRA